MKDSIYTIPISEVFEPKCGCPLCTLFDQLETRWVEYITGAAMMEPDIRVETNRRGFCHRHYGQMVQQRNRLSVALVLQTRLAYLLEHLEEGAPKPVSLFGKKREDSPAQASCFVCDKIDSEFLRIADNLVVLWAREADFRLLYAQQEFLCMPHFQVMLSQSRKLKGQEAKEFVTVTAALARKRLEQLKGNIDEFCQLFDHRNAGAALPGEAVSSSIEHTIAFLTGHATEK